METLEIVKILESPKISHDQAIKLAEAINGRSGIATREDLLKVESSLKEDLLKVESSLKEDLLKVESSLKENVKNLENRVIKLEISLNWLKGMGLAIIALLVKLTFFN